MENQFEVSHGIWCRVSGGVTGTREAWLREAGKQWVGTHEQAEQYANKLHTAAQKRDGLTSYSYKARALSERSYY